MADAIAIGDHTFYCPCDQGYIGGHGECDIFEANYEGDTVSFMGPGLGDGWDGRYGACAYCGRVYPYNFEEAAGLSVESVTQLTGRQRRTVEHEEQYGTKLSDWRFVAPVAQCSRRVMLPSFEWTMGEDLSHYGVVRAYCEGPRHEQYEPATNRVTITAPVEAAEKNHPQSLCGMHAQEVVGAYIGYGWSVTVEAFDGN